MAEKDEEKPGVTRREFMTSTGLTTLALGTGALANLSASSSAKAQASQSASTNSGPYNILFILTDQERYFDRAILPRNYSLPARERLAKEGVTFTNHQIGSSVCSSSRSVIYTGQHIQHTGVFDNLGFPWAKELSKDMPTLGTYLAKAGYYPAYLGKCHLIDAFEEVETGQAPDVDMAELNRGHATVWIQ